MLDDNLVLWHRRTAIMMQLALGSGPSGRTVSLRLAKNSFSVALVENELVGGDCAYWACVPSKALLRPPEALTEAREVDGSRQAAQGLLSVESVLTRRDTFVDHWNDDNLTKMLARRWCRDNKRTRKIGWTPACNCSIE